MAEGRRAAVPGDQRQRLGHEVEVRQPLRLPPLARRRHLPRDRRHARRQGRRRLRLRRRRQGLGGLAARPGLPRRRHRDRPDLRAAGVRWRATTSRRSRTSSRRPTSSSRRPATRTSSPPTDMARMKHQAIVGNIGHFDNEIDIAGLEKTPGIERDQHQAAGRQVGLPRRPRDHPAVRGPPAEPRQRDRPPVVRDVELVHEPDDRADRAVHEQRRRTTSRSTCCPSSSTRRSRGCTSTRSARSSRRSRPSRPPTSACPVEGPYKSDHVPLLARHRRDRDRDRRRRGPVAGRGRAGPHRVGGRADARPALDPRALRAPSARSTALRVARLPARHGGDGEPRADAHRGRRATSRCARRTR